MIKSGEAGKLTAICQYTKQGKKERKNSNSNYAGLPLVWPDGYISGCSEGCGGFSWKETCRKSQRKHGEIRKRRLGRRREMMIDPDR